jgi:uncharacterized protein with GYD domain
MMPKYLIEVNYTREGVKGLKAEGGSARVAAATALIESVGGTVDSFHFALGETDAHVITDMPDAVSAAGALAVNAGGGATTRTVALLTATEADAAAAKKTLYRPPGN